MPSIAWATDMGEGFYVRCSTEGRIDTYHVRSLDCRECGEEVGISEIAAQLQRLDALGADMPDGPLCWECEAADNRS